MKNKIGWCNLTFNPAWGCRNKCPYCYARRIAKRFWKRRYEDEFNFYYMAHPNWVWTGDYLSGLKDFKPTFLYSQYCKKLPKKPQKIFVGSMSEIAHWEVGWVNAVLRKIKQYPQHVFQFLTRYPEVYDRYIFPKNCWLGVTITKMSKDGQNHRWDFNSFIRNDNIHNLRFISFEPLLDEINFNYYLHFEKEINWIIIGAESGNRKSKVIPKKEWIENIVNYCRYKDIPVYLKDSLKNIYPVEIKEFPKIKKERRKGDARTKECRR